MSDHAVSYTQETCKNIVAASRLKTEDDKHLNNCVSQTSLLVIVARRTELRCANKGCNVYGRTLLLSISLVSVRTNTHIIFIIHPQGVFALLGHRGLVTPFTTGLCLSGGGYWTALSESSYSLDMQRLIKANNWNNFIQRLGA